MPTHRYSTDTIRKIVTKRKQKQSVQKKRSIITLKALQVQRKRCPERSAAALIIMITIMIVIIK